MGTSRFRKPRTRGLRIWHWLNAIVITGSLLTVLLRETLFDRHVNATLIETKLFENGIGISSELAMEIAILFRDKLWQWHIFLGLTLTALVLIRFTVYLVHKARGIPGLKVFAPGQSLHESVVYLSYRIFYVAVTLMVISGLTLVFYENFGISENMAESVEGFHKLMMWFFLAFVIGHIVGVVVAENQNDPGLVSDMINGGEENKNN